MTSKAGRGGRRTAPYAFTGVAMLSSVLRGPRAVRVNIEIIRVFVRLMSFSALTPGNKLSIKWHGHCHGRAYHASAPARRQTW